VRQVVEERYTLPAEGNAPPEAHRAG
jgi:hypothetical protein